jgi:hypothetical protein
VELADSTYGFERHVRDIDRVVDASLMSKMESNLRRSSTR